MFTLIHLTVHNINAADTSRIALQTNIDNLNASCMLLTRTGWYAHA